MKLLMLKGLPASGKSSYAEELVKGGGNWVRINKDLIRTMLHFDKFNGLNEKATKFTSEALATLFLLQDKNVVIDDTNMGDKHLETWKQVAKENESTFEIKNFDTDIETCIQRDRYREKSVGHHVIKQMALQYGIVKPKKKWILCDIDGTIANLEHRLPYVKDVEEKDWKSFFADMKGDTLIESTHKILKQFYKDGNEIIFVTARPDNYRRVTEKWLVRNIEVPWYTIIMRKENDTREDSIIKQQILDTYFDKDDIKFVIDDRPRVIRMWKENGLSVIDVGPGPDHDF